MKAIYAWHGEDTYVERCRANGITRILFPANDVTLLQIQHARNNGFEAGLYINPQWYSYPEAKAFRRKITEALTRLVDAAAPPPPIQINNERHDPLYMMAIMYWYRRSYQLRETSWCIEGYQGGWVGPMFRTSYTYTHPDLLSPVQLTPALLAGTELVPQCYDGDMNPYDPHDVVKDLVDWGSPYQAITPIVGGEYARWSSRRANQYLYLQSRLPT